MLLDGSICWVECSLWTFFQQKLLDFRMKFTRFDVFSDKIVLREPSTHGILSLKLAIFHQKTPKTNPKSRKKRTWKGKNQGIRRSSSLLFLFIEYLRYSKKKENTHKEWNEEGEETDNWAVKESLLNEEKKK